MTSQDIERLRVYILHRETPQDFWDLLDQAIDYFPEKLESRGIALNQVYDILSDAGEDEDASAIHLALQVIDQEL